MRPVCWRVSLYFLLKVFYSLMLSKQCPFLPPLPVTGDSPMWSQQLKNTIQFIAHLFNISFSCIASLLAYSCTHGTYRAQFSNLFTLLFVQSSLTTRPCTQSIKPAKTVVTFTHRSGPGRDELKNAPSGGGLLRILSRVLCSTRNPSPRWSTRCKRQMR